MSHLRTRNQCYVSLWRTMQLHSPSKPNSPIDLHRFTDFGKLLDLSIASACGSISACAKTSTLSRNSCKASSAVACAAGETAAACAPRPRQSNGTSLDCESLEYAPMPDNNVEIIARRTLRNKPWTHLRNNAQRLKTNPKNQFIMNLRYGSLCDIRRQKKTSRLT